MLDTNKILSSLLCKDLNQKKGETLFLIWYKSFDNTQPFAYQCTTISSNFPAEGVKLLHQMHQQGDLSLICF